jgi:serine/threonine protein kinase
MSLRIGDVVKGEVSSYRVKDSIGAGGMSTVWLAVDIATNRNVVLKVPNGQGIPFHKLIFERDLLKRLSHEHLCNYIDAGIHGFLPFLAMEFAMGKTLEQAAAGKSLDEKEVKARAAEILLAVDYLHSRNIIHRDIKPKNLIISDLEYLKLLDLGTATFFNTAGIGEAIISPGGYTPPEQFRFTSSIQGDIWSTAATCFFMLTGQNPEIVLQGYPDRRPPTSPDPRRFNHDVSNEFAQIVMKGMSFDPTERYSTAREMIEAIER